jgi:hypothetical protein
LFIPFSLISGSLRSSLLVLFASFFAMRYCNLSLFLNLTI